MTLMLQLHPRRQAHHRPFIFVVIKRNLLHKKRFCV
jgi:hypothetical protein